MSKLLYDKPPESDSKDSVELTKRGTLLMMGSDKYETMPDTDLSWDNDIRNRLIAPLLLCKKMY
jgi:hypothetical protein